MSISHLLDLPSVSLSSGQTRRARIATALLTQPVLLLLEDPMAGLDISSRQEVSEVLERLLTEGEIQLILILRGKGVRGMPQWVTAVCEVRNGEVWLGSRESWEKRSIEEKGFPVELPSTARRIRANNIDSPLVEMRDISISYGQGSRPVNPLTIAFSGG